jgi:hypothetical protein
MAMRVGKSKVLVDDFGGMVFAELATSLLVLAPAGVYETWKTAIEADFPDGLLEQTRIFIWDSARVKQDRAERVSFLEYREGPRVLLVNIEALSTVAMAKAMCEEFLLRSPRGSVLAIDESVVIMNRRAKRTKFILNTLAPIADFRRILTGLVNPKNPLDVYTQFKFLDPTIFPEPFEEFRSEYAIIERMCTLPDKVVRNRFRSAFRLDVAERRPEKALEVAKKLWPDADPKMMISFVANADKTMSRSEMVDAIFRAGRYIESIPVIKGFKNLDKLNRRIAPHCFRARLEDCYDLPPSDYSFRDVSFTPEQEAAYAELKNNAIAILEAGTVTTSIVLTQILRLHQVCCGHTKTDEGEVIQFPENRTEALVDLISEYEGKAIIWCSYELDILKLTGVLEKEFGEGCVARFWGGNRAVREGEEKRFKTDPACRFMLSTPSAGGRGRPWEEADLVVYYSCREDLDHRLQSEERAKAVGKNRQVAYVDLRIPGTVEEKIIKRLREKIDWASEVLAEEWPNWLI